MGERFTGTEIRLRQGTWSSDCGQGGCLCPPPPLPPPSAADRWEDVKQLASELSEMATLVAVPAANVAALSAEGAREILQGASIRALWALFRVCEGFALASSYCLSIESAAGGGRGRLIAYWSDRYTPLRVLTWLFFRMCEVTFLASCELLEVEQQFGGGRNRLVGSTQRNENQDAGAGNVLGSGSRNVPQLMDGALTPRVIVQAKRCEEIEVQKKGD